MIIYKPESCWMTLFTPFLANQGLDLIAIISSLSQ